MSRQCVALRLECYAGVGAKIADEFIVRKKAVDSSSGGECSVRVCKKLLVC